MAKKNYGIADAMRSEVKTDEPSRIPEQKGMKLPPLIFAQSGAMYFEK